MTEEFINNMLMADCEDLVLTRKVLFEKYDPYLGAILLTDIDNWQYPNMNIQSVIQAIENLNPFLLGEMDWNGELFSDVVNLSNVSHLIKNVSLIDRKIYGEITWLDTPAGRIMKEILKNNFQLKFEVRATGHTNQTETIVHNIITWDVKTIK
jgi:hypothetical protein